MHMKYFHNIIDLIVLKHPNDFERRGRVGRVPLGGWGPLWGHIGLLHMSFKTYGVFGIIFLEILPAF